MQDSGARRSGADRFLENRTALVTGASRGIGRAVALALAAAGANLLLVSRASSDLEQLTREIESGGGRADFILCDLGSRESFQDLLAGISQSAFINSGSGSSTGIDILVNNAGICRVDEHTGSSAPAGDWSASKDWLNTLEINLTAPYELCRYLAPSMVERQWGRIVNIASISGRKGECYAAAYTSSKFGLVGLTQALALELARHAITVNAVCPGWVETDMARAQLENPQWCELNEIEPRDSIDIARLSVPQMRFIQPEEVAGLVSFLCTDSARGITGQAINVCGGLSLL